MLSQGRTWDKLLDEKTGTILQLADLMKRNNAGMMKSCSATRLAEEPLRIGIARQCSSAWQLEGDFSFQFGVPGAKHLGEGACSPFLQQEKATEVPIRNQPRDGIR